MLKKLSLFCLISLAIVSSGCGRRFISQAESNYKFNVEKVVAVGTVPSEIELDKDEKTKVNGVVHFDDGSTTDQVKWKSSDESIIKVDNDGNVYALSEGNATLTATSIENNFKKKEIPVKVLDKTEYDNSTSYNYPNNLDDFNSIDEKERKRFIGNFRTIDGYLNGDRSLEYGSNNSGVSSNSGTINITPNNRNAITAVGVSSKEIDLKNGESNKVDAFVYYKDGSITENLKWTSSDESIVKVDNYGNIKAVSEGKAEIKAISSENNFKEETIEITVKNDTETSE